MVNLLAARLGSSHSSIWLQLKQLKLMGLMSFGSAQKKGAALKPTPIGVLITKRLGKDDSSNILTKYKNLFVSEAQEDANGK